MVNETKKFIASNLMGLFVQAIQGQRTEKLKTSICNCSEGCGYHLTIISVSVFLQSFPAVCDSSFDLEVLS